MRRVFVDTSAFYALVSSTDSHHDEAIAFARDLDKRRVPVFTSNYCVAETHSLIVSRIGHHSARRWLEKLDVPVDFATEDDFEAAKRVVLRHRDQDYSFTDAVSMVVMRRTGVEEVFGFDRHFATAGFTLRGPEGGMRAH